MILVEREGKAILIDAGLPLQKRLYEEGVDPRTIESVIITHAHADHLMGLPGLLFELEALGFRESPLILVGRSHEESVSMLLSSFKPSRMALNLSSFNDSKGEVMDVASFRIEVFPVLHSMPTVGVRVFDATGDCVLFYSSDTIMLEELKELANCKVGLHEATLPEGMASEARERGFHSTPSQALRVLEKSRKKVLYHISEYSFRDGYPKGDYIVAQDGLVLGP